MAAVDSFQLLYREMSRSCSFYYEALALVGALYAAGTAVLLLRDCCTMVRVHFLPRMIPTKRLTQRFGDWAVITGTNATGKQNTSRCRSSGCWRRALLLTGFCQMFDAVVTTDGGVTFFQVCQNLWPEHMPRSWPGTASASFWWVPTTLPSLTLLHRSCTATAWTPLLPRPPSPWTRRPVNPSKRP